MLQFSFKKGKLTSKAGARFVELLGGDDLAFDNLYCVAFQMLDRQWLAKRATYMEFNVNYIPCFMFLVCEFIELGFSPFISLLLSPPLFFPLHSGGSQVHKNATGARTFIGRHFVRTRHAGVQNVK